MSRLVRALRATALAASLCAAPAAMAEPAKQYFPLATFRVGAYASSGIPSWAGVIDYFRYINEIEGGINGVKLIWDECETEWAVEKGVECYERMKGGKDGSPVPIFLPHGDPVSKALTEKSVADKIPLVTTGYGRTEAIDGRVFPYSFTVLFSFWSEASSAVNYIAEQVGGKDKLKGLKIATVYHDSPYGKETQTPLALLAKTYGFEDIQIPVPHPGNDQSAQWARIRQIKPDWVFLRGWGVMTPVAIKTAAKTGFPVDHIIGGIWSGSEEDVRPAGSVGKGYLAITPFPASQDFEILKKIKAAIVDKGKSDLKDLKSFGSVYYNSGLIEAIISVEAIRTAQARFGNRPITGAEGQWGLEHLVLDEDRLRAIGAEGLVQPLRLSIKDHEGGGAGKVLQWDGAKWTIVSNGWVKSDRELLLPLIYERAAAYAKEKGITPRSVDSAEAAAQ
ncbi:ABC transporter substrate-binding protein [Methylobacterium pseudosasicola]|uniref:Amino acid/amide ABC transporter substrate-binding protein, HAAT family n=1 Tax=Methylobacterium pseudosasicola TaxID=582667 RepID=A0A1I4HD15_9HYPH|nr:ABC transporter substrate-binding protein [Methylobacterium pseudosasicola]SFL39351.1 amino acid/amide ABC transporter substrate-binding protein, HAAT family [Methylobacterium pseudosasicola]